MHRLKLFNVLLILSLVPSCSVIDDWFGHSIQDPARPFCSLNDCCKTDQDCFEFKKTAGDPDPSNWTCVVDQQRCAPQFIECRDDDDSACCPGQRCSMITEEDGLCADSFTSCVESEPSSCAVKGQYCEPNLGTSGSTSPGCTFRACMADSDCTDGLRCFNGSCIGEAPCSGGCQPGEVCVPTTNRCFRFKQSPTQGCQMTCSDGNMLVFADPTNIFGLCNAKMRECACLPLPDFDAK